MADLTPGLVVVASLFPFKDVINKVLGPTADYFGERTLEATKHCAENLGRVFQVAWEKLGSQVERPGQVNPRVCSKIVDDGRFVEDEFSTEYFGGLLASARTADGTDDSALPHVAVVKSLSSLQIRLHFVLYCVVSKHRVWPKEEPLRLPDIELRIPSDELLRAMGLGGFDGEGQLALALHGLIDSDLILAQSSWKIGDLRKDWKASIASSDTVIIRPTSRGGSLFFRALGLKGLHPEIIHTVTVEACLSEQIKSAIRLPDRASCRLRPLKDHLTQIADALEDRLNDLESEIESVKSDVDDLGQEITKLDDQLSTSDE